MKWKRNIVLGGEGGRGYRGSGRGSRGGGDRDSYRDRGDRYGDRYGGDRYDDGPRVNGPQHLVKDRLERGGGRGGTFFLF